MRRNKPHDDFVISHCFKCKQDFNSRLKYSGLPMRNCPSCLEKQRQRNLEKKKQKEQEEKNIISLDKLKLINKFKETYLEKINCDLNEDPKEEIDKQVRVLKEIWEKNEGIRSELIDYMMTGQIRKIEKALF